jgi:hypothetical protein
LKLAGSLQMNIWSIEILNEVVMVRLDWSNLGWDFCDDGGKVVASLN